MFLRSVYVAEPTARPIVSCLYRMAAICPSVTPGSKRKTVRFSTTVCLLDIEPTGVSVNVIVGLYSA